MPFINNEGVITFSHTKNEMNKVYRLFILMLNVIEASILKLENTNGNWKKWVLRGAVLDSEPPDVLLEHEHHRVYCV